jgi:hypothetical protein
LGQYPTDYKKEVESLEAAAAVLSISDDDGITRTSQEASQAVQEYVIASARHQANRPKGSAIDDARWRELASEVESARQRWSKSRDTFTSATRSALKSLK